jgi:2-keto-4-pentenoate hydratase
MSTETEQRIAREFVGARRSARALSAYPGPIPRTLTAAYRIQDHAIAAMGLPIGGWKVGRIVAPLAQYGAERLAGPVFIRSIQHAAPGGMPAGFVFAGGYAAAEAEFLFEIGEAPAGNRDLSTAELAERVRRVHVGIEIASSPFPGINDLGPAVTVSDFGNNNGLIIGPEVPDWRRGALFERTVSTRIDGRKAGSGRGSDIPGGPLSSLGFLLEHLAARGIAVQPGAWISSGAITGVHEVRIGERVTAHFGRDLAVECLIEQARPYEAIPESAAP